MRDPKPHRTNEQHLLVDERLALVQTAQHGLITLQQASDLRIDYASIARRARRGLLAPARAGRSGVYLDPAAPRSIEQQILGAVLAGGAGAFASHESSAWLCGLPLSGTGFRLEITVPAARRPRLRGVRIHRSHLLSADDIVTVRGIPAASASRVVVDLSVRLTVAQLGKLADTAVKARLTTWSEIRATTDRLAPSPGRSKHRLEAMLARRVEADERTESYLEDFVLEALNRFAVRRPIQQHWVTLNGRRRCIDHCYVDERIALEALGYEWHVGLRERWDDDRLRGNELAIAGYSVLEFTSGFTDWQIAEQVARKLGDPVPTRPHRPLTYLDWKRRRGH